MERENQSKFEILLPASFLWFIVAVQAVPYWYNQSQRAAKPCCATSKTKLHSLQKRKPTIKSMDSASGNVFIYLELCKNSSGLIYLKSVSLITR